MKKIILAILACSIPFATTIATTIDEQGQGDNTCVKTFGENAYWNGLYDEKGLYICDCGNGYEFDVTATKCVKARTVENGNAICRANFGALSYWDGKEWSRETGYICSCQKGATWNDDYTECIDIVTVKVSDGNLTLQEIPFIEDRISEAMLTIHNYMSSYDETKRNKILNSLISTFEAKKKSNMIASDIIIVNKITTSLKNLRDNWDTY